MQEQPCAAKGAVRLTLSLRLMASSQHKAAPTDRCVAAENGRAKPL